MQFGKDGQGADSFSYKVPEEGDEFKLIDPGSVVTRPATAGVVTPAAIADDKVDRFEFSPVTHLFGHVGSSGEEIGANAAGISEGLEAGGYATHILAGMVRRVHQTPFVLILRRFAGKTLKAEGHVLDIAGDVALKEVAGDFVCSCFGFRIGALVFA